MPRPKRRDVLKKAGVGIVTGSLVGLAGCSDGGGDGGSDGGDGGGDGGSDGGDGGGTTEGSVSGSLKVGVLEPLSGPTAISGQEAQQGSRVTRDLIEEETDLEIELVVEDTEASPDTGVQRARALIQQENVDIIHGIVSSAVAKAVVEFTSQQQVPLIGTATQTPDITKEQCSRYTFRTTTNLIHQQRATAKLTADNIAGEGEAVDVHGVNPDYVYGQQSWEVFKDVYPNELNSAANITGSEFPAFLKGDYNQEIQAILDQDPDIVHSSLYSGDMISFIQQAQQFDFFDQIDAFLAGVVPMEVNIALGPENTPDNLWTAVSTYFRWPESKLDQLESFNQMYRDRYDQPSAGEPTSFTYENAKAMRAIQQGAEKAGSTNVEDIIDAMEGLTVDKAPAPPATIREGDHQAIADQFLTGPHGPVDNYDWYGIEEFQPVSGDFIADDVECSF